MPPQTPMPEPTTTPPAPVPQEPVAPVMQPAPTLPVNDGVVPAPPVNGGIPAAPVELPKKGGNKGVMIAAIAGAIFIVGLLLVALFV